MSGLHLLRMETSNPLDENCFGNILDGNKNWRITVNSLEILLYWVTNISIIIFYKVRFLNYISNNVIDN